MKFRCLFSYFLFLVSLYLEAAEIYLTSDIAVDTNLVAENIYFLDGVVSVLPGSTLSIEPGTIVRGLPASETSNGNLSALFVLPGARIVAKGTAESPIIFTNKDDNSAYVNTENLGNVGGFSTVSRKAETRENFANSQLKRWGGLYILGNAFVDEMGVEDVYSTDPDTLLVPGGFGKTGLINALETILGSTPYPLLRSYDPNDDSGELEYVSIRYTGDATTYLHRGDPNYTIQPAALTLYGVGAGTNISNIEVLNAGDDVFSLRGGSVEPSYLAAYVFGDECFEIDCGWSGKLQRIFGYGIYNSSEFIEVVSYPSESVSKASSTTEVAFATYLGVNNRRGIYVSRGGYLDMKSSYLSFYEDGTTLSDPLYGGLGLDVRVSGNQGDVMQDTSINVYNSIFLTNSSFAYDLNSTSDYLDGISTDSEIHFSADVYSDNYELVKSLRVTQGAFAYGENWTDWMIGHQHLTGTSAEYVALTLPQGIDYTVDSDSDGIPDNYDLYDGLDDALFEYYLQNNVLPNYITVGDYNTVVAERDAKLSLAEVAELRPGSTMIEVSGNQATIQLQMEESSDLESWEDTGAPATMVVPADTDTKFFRFKITE